ncbi:MAG: CoA pyrophosphatase [Anaerolineae bacterium]|nr:CoA pyrophosphatase [Anaerolineae bacterium]
MPRLVIPLSVLEAALRLPGFDVEAARQPMHLIPNLRRTALPPDILTRQAAVLVPVYPADDGLTTVLIRRAPDPGVHSGQIGFPGGALEPGDGSPVAAALREAYEEIGLLPAAVRVLGELAAVYIPPSGFVVTPVLGVLAERPAFHPNPTEVVGLLELPLADLLDDARKREQEMILAGVRCRVPYYDVAGQVVWGATALMLAELEGRLRAVLGRAASEVQAGQ